MGAVARTALQATRGHVRGVTAVRPDAAEGLVADVYAQVQQDFGMLAPPISLHSPAPGPLAASWLMLRETLVAAGRADRATKEAVAAAVSLGNACPYCVDVHGATLHGLLGGAPAAAVAADRLDTLADPGVQAVAAWARAGAAGEGDGSQAPPVPAGQVPEVVGVVLTFHYLNRMVNVFLTESPLPPRLPARARPAARRLLGRVMRPAARRSPAPGRSLPLLPAAPLPADLSWSTGSGAVAEALARAAAAVELAGRRSVPAPVRELVLARLSTWDGRPPALGRDWLDDAVAGTGPADRPAARLALLAAQASYRVEDSIVDAYRAGAGDRAVVELVSWASLAAARRAAGRAAAGIL